MPPKPVGTAPAWLAVTVADAAGDVVVVVVAVLAVVVGTVVGWTEVGRTDPEAEDDGVTVTEGLVCVVKVVNGKVDELLVLRCRLNYCRTFAR